MPKSQKCVPPHLVHQSRHFHENENLDNFFVTRPILKILFEIDWALKMLLNSERTFENGRVTKYSRFGFVEVLNIYANLKRLSEVPKKSCLIEKFKKNFFFDFLKISKK